MIIVAKGVVAAATPVLFASLGETITEKSGIINLSLDGSILLSAMTAFAVSYETGNLVYGVLAGAGVGALVAGIVALFSISLHQSQVAVGFVLTLMCRELAYFLGNPYSRLSGPQVSPFPVPVLKDIPVMGSVLFTHNILVYMSIALILMVYYFFYHTRPGLHLRIVGEHPAAAFSKGVNPAKVKLFYAVLGGGFVGIAGASFSLFDKPGWGRPQGAEGTGWIALALVIFGGWHPVKVAAGAYLFAFLQVMSIYFQKWMPQVPAQVFQVAPFPLMIFTLLLISLMQKDAVVARFEKNPCLKKLAGFISQSPPRALGKHSPLDG